MPSQADSVVANLTREVEKAVKTLVLEVTRNLIKATPVNTGWARANWVPSLGTPFEGTSSQPAPHAKASNAEQQAGQAAVLAFKLTNGAAFVSNNVPYINALDLGSSRQAPAGFVEAAIDQALATVQQRYAGLDIDITTQGAGTFSDLAGGAAADNLASAYSPLGGDE